MWFSRRKDFNLNDEGGAWSDIRKSGYKPRANEGSWLKKMLKNFTSGSDKK